MTKKRIYSSLERSSIGEVKLKSGKITDVEVFIYGGIIEALPLIGENKEKTELHPRGGTLIDEKKYERVKKKVGEKCESLKGLEKLLEKLKQKEKAMQRLIKTKNVEKYYDEASQHQGLENWLMGAFWNVPPKVFRKELKNALPKNTCKEKIDKLWLTFLNPPKDIPSLEAVNSWLYEEKESLKIAKSKEEELKFKKMKKPNRDAREEKTEVFKEVEKLVTEKKFNKIKRWVKRIEEIQRINETRHRYAPRYSKIISKKGEKDPEFIKSKIEKYGMREIEGNEKN